MYSFMCVSIKDVYLCMYSCYVENLSYVVTNVSASVN